MLGLLHYYILATSYEEINEHNQSRHEGGPKSVDRVGQLMFDKVRNELNTFSLRTFPSNTRTSKLVEKPSIHSSPNKKRPPQECVFKRLSQTAAKFTIPCENSKTISACTLDTSQESEVDVFQIAFSMKPRKFFIKLRQ